MPLSTKTKYKYVVEVIFSVLFLLVSGIINWQFIGGANLNLVISGHDEYLTVREVYSIIEPLSMKHWIMAFLHGDFLAYGSIMFYFDALVSFIPYKLLGLEGLVYSIRMTHAFFIAAALSLLSFTFIKNNFSKILFFIAALGIAKTYYFTMLPKPEPMQLFFFALFLYYFKKNNWNYGRHFIWLGLAFGLKITIIIFLPIIFIYPWIVAGEASIKKKIIGGIWSGVYFMIGLVIAVPYLLLIPVKPSYFASYLDANFGQSEKVYDDSTVTAVDWLQQGLGGSYLGMDSLGWVFMILLGLVLILGFARFMKDKLEGTWLIALFAIVFILIIALKVNRLWPHYLWMGFILGILALNLSYERSKFNIVKTGLLIANIIIVLLISYRFIAHTYPEYFLADTKESIVKRIDNSKEAFEYIHQSYPEGISVATDGTIYYPYSQFVVAHPYNPFSTPLPDDGETDYYWYMNDINKIWDANHDIIMYGDRHPVKDKASIQEKYPQWNANQLEISFNKHLKNDYEFDKTIGGIDIYRRRN